MANIEVWNRIWKDKDGKLVLYQKPNTPIIVWAVSWLLTKVLPYGQWNFAAELIAYGAIFTWAWLELFQGTTYFRRLLGLVVLVAVVLNRLY